MSRLILQCSLDRLGPHYADVPLDPAAPVPPAPVVPYVDFSLSVNCGFDVSPEGDDILRLKPWFWKPWTKVCICGIPTAGGPPKDLGTVEVLGNVAGEWNSVPTPQGINARTVRFLADLESAFQERSSLPANFVFSADTVTRANRPWHAVVGAAASWPGGLNRWLNLTLGFRLPETSLAAYSAIMAAPLGPQSYPIKVAATDKTPNTRLMHFPSTLPSQRFPPRQARMGRVHGTGPTTRSLRAARPPRA